MPTTLEWEKFDFSDNPKWDHRFKDDEQDDNDVNNSHAANGQQEDARSTTTDAAKQQQSSVSELELDTRTANNFNKNVRAWQTLDETTVIKAIEILKPYVREKRVAKIESVLRRRNMRIRFLFENPSNPSNVFACLRTIESFGLQQVDVIIDSSQYLGKAAISQKRGMRTAMGTAQWLTIRNHASTVEAIRALREESNCYVLASDLSQNSKDIRTINWNDILL